jgi:hypothetical protein
MPVQVLPNGPELLPEQSSVTGANVVVVVVVVVVVTHPVFTTCPIFAPLHAGSPD